MRTVRTLAFVSALLAPLLGLALHPGPARAGEDPGPPIEATFANARAKDELRGFISQNTTEVHVLLRAPAGSTLDATLAPDAALGAAASELELMLCAIDGATIEVAGTPADRSKPGSGVVTWKGVPLPESGEYTLVVRANMPGGYLLKLGARDAKLVVDETSTEDLALDATASVEFDGRVGDVLRYDLSPGPKSKFRGELRRIVRPDASDVAGLGTGPKGKLTLDADGRFRLEFGNAGSAPGAWRALLRTTPRKAQKRRGVVSIAQTGLVPVVRRLSPSRGVQVDTALDVTLSGRDFQPGMDIRLERGGRAPIIASDVTVVSETEATCTLNLDTRSTPDGASTGTWRVAVRNAPLYGDPDDPTTLDTDTLLVDTSRSFKSLASGSVRLPRGVIKQTEVWQLHFNADFAEDLDRMGLSSVDADMRRVARDVMEAYVLAYVRDLFGTNETNGAVKGSAVPVSFVVDDVTSVAGKAGETYNRIEIGGAAQAGDPTDAAEPLAWGHADTDTGNQRRDDLSVEDADGNRIGLGARTRILDPRGANPDASAAWRQAMQPLRANPLTDADLRYFTGRFNPGNATQNARYAEIVTQFERAAREIAGIVAHHVGRAMGLATAGSGPMAAPTESGSMATERTTLAFSSADMATLRGNAVAHELPGKSDLLRVSFFPIVDRQPELLPNLTTATAYEVKWDFVGGRCNAVPADYRLSYLQGSHRPLGLTLSFTSLAGTAPTCLNGATCTSIGDVYCRVAVFAVQVDDTVRGGGSLLYHRLKILPNLAFFQGSPIFPSVQNCYNQVLAAP